MNLLSRRFCSNFFLRTKTANQWMWREELRDSESSRTLWAGGGPTTKFLIRSLYARARSLSHAVVGQLKASLALASSFTRQATVWASDRLTEVTSYEISPTSLMPDTHRRRVSTVELSRVGGMNAPDGRRDPAVYSVLCFWWQWRHNDAIVEKVINIDPNSRSQTAMESVSSVSKLSTEYVGSRRELVANCVHTVDAVADADATRLDSWVASASAVCIEHKTPYQLGLCDNSWSSIWSCS